MAARIELKCGGAAILMQLDNNISLCLGTRNIETNGFAPFSDHICSFLDTLSSALLKAPSAKSLPDIAAFAFWCRKSNLQRLRQTFDDGKLRKGRGLAFHISPSNVPINAFYSYVFGLLSGNANIVRLSGKASNSIDIMLDITNDLLTSGRHNEVAKTTAFIRYDHNAAITDKLSFACDARIIWGGDSTITEIRKSSLQPRAQEITFADRYSFAVIDAEAVRQSSKDDLEKLATAFFNDTLQMDQNACSSPHLVLWLNGHLTDARERFWQSFNSHVQANYSLEPVQAVDRYSRLLSGFILNTEQRLTTDMTDAVQRVSLSHIPANVDSLRGEYGLFYEYNASALDEMAHIVNNKYQTLSYFGVEKETLRDFVINNRLNGIDRMVPLGEALNISSIWDGHDVLQTLTRIIDVK
jgi:hypothetical protein